MIQDNQMWVTKKILPLKTKDLTSFTKRLNQQKENYSYDVVECTHYTWVTLHMLTKYNKPFRNVIIQTWSQGDKSFRMAQVCQHILQRKRLQSFMVVCMQWQLPTHFPSLEPLRTSSEINHFTNISAGLNAKVSVLVNAIQCCK